MIIYSVVFFITIIVTSINVINITNAEKERLVVLWIDVTQVFHNISSMALLI